MAGLLATGRELLCEDLLATHGGLVAALQARRAYARAWSHLGSALHALASAQLPALAPAFERLSALLAGVAEIHAALADAEEANAEDFRDIFERFAVLYRQALVNSEAKAGFAGARAAHAAAAQAVAAARGTPAWAKAELRLLQQEAGAKAMLRAARDRYRATLRELARVREAYTAFKIRRLRAGFLRYARALREASERERGAFARIAELLGALGPGEAAAAVGAQLAAAPPGAAAPGAAVAAAEEQLPD
jgi:hypothetical protein